MDLCPDGLPTLRTATRISGSFASLFPRAVSSHPGEPVGCIQVPLDRRLQASPNPDDWPLPLCVTRPKRVQFCYGSRVRRTGLRLGDCSFRRRIGYMLDTYLTCWLRFKSIEKPGLVWRTGLHGWKRIWWKSFEPPSSPSEEEKMVLEVLQRLKCGGKGMCMMGSSTSKLVRKLGPFWKLFLLGELGGEISLNINGLPGRSFPDIVTRHGPPRVLM